MRPDSASSDEIAGHWGIRGHGLVRARVLLATLLVTVPLAWSASPLTGSGQLVLAADGTTVMASRAEDGTAGNGHTIGGRLADGGSLITFTSSASNLLADDADTNGQDDVFIKHVATGVVELVSVSKTGGPADGLSFLQDISADGRFVAFSSVASNLVDEPVPAFRYNLYLRDRTAGTTRFIDVEPSTAILSDDARYLIFDSGRDDLFDGQAASPYYGVFRMDLASTRSKP